MIHFFQSPFNTIYALSYPGSLSVNSIDRLLWLFGGGTYLQQESLEGFFVGPRKEMITPWSTNAVEITQNMGLEGIERIEEFAGVASVNAPYDRMLQNLYEGLRQDIFSIVHPPDPIVPVSDIAAYNRSQGLALSADEVSYLEDLSQRLGRKLTDSEVFGFSQVNSEHCRHKIFNGTFVIDGREMPETLFQLIKKTSRLHPNRLVSAYKDNVAFILGPAIEQFAPLNQDRADFFAVRDIDAVISLKAETHNFPTTVEPFNGAATGSGGEIRDRMAGGKGSLPIAGTAVYITSYPRLDASREWEYRFPARAWLYQSPDEILIKASNGASDFGNKFGQPLICGSVLTFEHAEGNKTWGFDKVIMLAGGIGFARKEDSLKDSPQPGDRIIVMGGDNYRIGMGGGAVSSVATGEYANSIELNAVQRSNPEMQKRVYNAIRALAELDRNPIVAIHDHGAGGHLNSLSELVEASGGHIHIDKLPVGDPTLSDKEIIGNESQERMGLIIKAEDAALLRQIAERERAPLYDVGEVTGNHRLVFENGKNGEKPVDLDLIDMFGNPPATLLQDTRQPAHFEAGPYSPDLIPKYINKVLQLEAVACKDWLTNKVDRSVTGRIATQQCAGPLQLPLNNAGVVALDYQGKKGIATALGHAPVAGLLDAAAGSRLSVAESLTNLVWTKLEGGLAGVSLSANWMWPAKQAGEDARLYEAVQALSDFVVELGINVPTGKDSLSMTQKYPDGSLVYSPGTVIVTAVGEVSDIKRTVSPVIVSKENAGPTHGLLYIDCSPGPFHLGGSSLAQVMGAIGDVPPDVSDAEYFRRTFEAVQELIGGPEDRNTRTLNTENRGVLAGHDVSAGGLVTTLLEMCFSRPGTGIEADLSAFEETDWVRILFSEKPGLVIQHGDAEKALSFLKEKGVRAFLIGKVTDQRSLLLRKEGQTLELDIDALRDTWYHTSYLLDRKQTSPGHAEARYENYKKQELSFRFPQAFDGRPQSFAIDPSRRSPSGIKAAIIREKGVNGDREMAWSLYYAGFDVKDVHMTDLISGRENLEDVHLIVFVGGFSNSDVLGSAKGWAGAFLYNPRAKESLDKFYARPDTLSLGICNGCQVMVELGLVYPEHKEKPTMLHNASHKFESIFLTVDIPQNNSVMFSSLAGSRLGVWVAHGEGRFSLPYGKERYHIGATYSQHGYPGNPNGSDHDVAALASDDGRHLVMMPHLERSLYPWQWGYYPGERKSDRVSPWVEAFVNARKWVEGK